MKRNDVSSGTIVGGMSRLKKVGQIFHQKRTETVYMNKVYPLSFVIKQNASAWQSGELIDINPELTFERVEPKKAGNFDKILQTLKKESRNQKRDINISVDESYIEAIEDGADIKQNDYLYWLEKTIIDLESYDKPDLDQNNAEKDALSSEYKELTGKSVGRMGVDTIKQKIKEFKEENNIL